VEQVLEEKMITARVETDNAVDRCGNFGPSVLLVTGSSPSMTVPDLTTWTPSTRLTRVQFRLATALDPACAGEHSCYGWTPWPPCSTSTSVRAVGVSSQSPGPNCGPLTVRSS